MKFKRITRLEIEGVFSQEMAGRLVSALKKIDMIGFDVKSIETSDHFKDIKREVVYDKLMGVLNIHEYSVGMPYCDKKWREQV